MHRPGLHGIPSLECGVIERDAIFMRFKYLNYYLFWQPQGKDVFAESV